jgi:hypothetical protein
MYKIGLVNIININALPLMNSEHEIEKKNIRVKFLR